VAPACGGEETVYDKAFVKKLRKGNVDGAGVAPDSGGDEKASDKAIDEN
jgi:hypothetical protein